ncbi:hypothetical protein SYJ56_22435 [Algoriphagus sp. D3-2-R+10]|uniref:hypothetical protein n=1 Tax=Algoriphagus aurantiacus TaxID=3103948 RepID=UPI002B378EAF|nr:hypothetical protein [Algoriphagus sp. D3-2-R+10]MEB2778088.1 hypothetical protein [Algoriphagus sp. D3-2-R+10]
MQYIDKSILENRGKTIVNNLLKACWDNDENKYKNANYDTLSKDPFKTNFKEVLLEEQNNLCCYCMKNLSNNNTTTLEHIIPHKSKKEEFDIYNHPNLNDNVLHMDEFRRDLNIIPPNKYPHDIAYHNLIASCDSNTHCNHGRGNKPIKVLIYNPNIHDEIEYNRKGHAYSEEYLDDLATLGISTNKNLILYRMIWSEIANNTTINPKDLTDNKIEEIILNMDYADNFSKVIDIFFDSPSKKPELLKYIWFFTYYK